MTVQTGVTRNLIRSRSGFMCSPEHSRQFGNDYNLALKELKVRFSESHAIQLLHRMEKSLMQMGEVMDKARQLTEDVRNRQNKNDKRI